MPKQIPKTKTPFEVLKYFGNVSFPIYISSQLPASKYSIILARQMAKYPKLCKTLGKVLSEILSKMGVIELTHK